MCDKQGSKLYAPKNTKIICEIYKYRRKYAKLIFIVQHKFYIQNLKI